MLKPICTDLTILASPCADATFFDKAMAQDLMDTLNHYADRCVGMAANMIGIKKKIIAINVGPLKLVMFNPRITNKKGVYKTIEGCLSLKGERETTRYKYIEVEYLDSNFNKVKSSYTDFIAQIIQHEIDHTNGVII